MSAIDLNSFVWASLGIEPPTPEDAIYEAGEQPIAGFDNFINWAVTSDIDALNDYAGDHAAEHEAGGSQEINLSGLTVGYAGRLVGEDSTDATEVRIETEAGAPIVRYDTANDRVREFPGFAITPTFHAGANIGGHLLRSGDRIYDYNDDRFHRAAHAQQADLATLAEDSELLEGYPASAFIREDDAVVEPSGDWSYENIVDADISGHAETASLAYEAQFAQEAEHAYTADDSDHLEGYTVQEILDMISGDIGDSFPAVDDDGVEQLAAALRLDFGQSIDVDTDGSTAEMSVESVPHADEAEYSFDSNRVDGYHASDLIAMMGDGGRWSKIGAWEINANDGFSWFRDLAAEGEVYDFYRLALVHEFPHDNKTHRPIYCQFNQDDRSRYNYRYSWYANYSVDHEVEGGASAFPLCIAPGTKRSMAEYTISAPRRFSQAGDVDNEDVFIGRVNNGVYPKTRPTFHHGSYNADAETVDQIHLYTPNHAIHGSIELWGRNIPR